MGAFALILAGILIAGIGAWLFIEDAKTVTATADRLDALDRKISASETQLNQKLVGYIAQITEAIQKDKAPPHQDTIPKQVVPFDVRIVGPVRFVSTKKPQPPKLPPLPKSLLPKKTKPSER